MTDLIRDAPIGQLIRLLTRNKFLKYPEEDSAFHCPGCYKEPEAESVVSKPELVLEKSANTNTETQVSEYSDNNATLDDEVPDRDVYSPDIEAFEPIRPGSAGTVSTEATHPPTRRQSLARVDTKLALKKSVTRADLEEQFAEAVRAETLSPETIEPEKLESGTVLVDWYTTDDPSNPQNWTLRKKIFVSSII